MPSILKLNESVLSKIRSHLALTSLGRISKELIENSIDAGSSEIRIYVDLRSLSIVVTDNGRGIPFEDLKNVGEQYYTSKFRCLEDISNLKTCGFRGEALYSLRCLSNLAIYTSRPGSDRVVRKCFVNNKAYLMECSESDLDAIPFSSEDFSLLKRQSGCVVVATGIFLGTPVRRQCLINSADTKIMKEIKEQIFVSLVNFPDIKVEISYLVSLLDKKRVLVILDCRSFDSKKLKIGHLALKLLGISIEPSLWICSQDSNVKGLVGFQDKLESSFLLYVCQRLILLSSKEISGLTRIVQNTLNKCEAPSMQQRKLATYRLRGSAKIHHLTRKKPFCLLFFDFLISGFDIIGDPSKQILQTPYWSSIENLIRKLFCSLLESNGWLFPIKPNKTSKSSNMLPLKRRFFERSGHELQPEEKSVDSKLRLSIANYDMNYHSDSDDRNECSNISEGTTYDSHIDLSQVSLANGEFEIINQIDKKFILLKFKFWPVLNERQDCLLLIIDQHACDERIRVEQFLEEFMIKVIDPASSLSIAIPYELYINLSTEEAALFLTYQKTLGSLGIEFLQPSQETIRITHLPRLLFTKGLDSSLMKTSLLEYLQELELKTKKCDFTEIQRDKAFFSYVNLPNIIIDLIKSRACRSAIMFGCTLSYNEIDMMVRNLFKCHFPFICAHGRPSVVPLADLNFFNNRIT